MGKNMKMNALCQTFGLEIGVVNRFSSNVTIITYGTDGLQNEGSRLNWRSLNFFNWKDYLRLLQMVDIF
jgi:hypothetical protein